MKNKKFLIDVIDVNILNEDDSIFAKGKEEVFKDENGKYCILHDVYGKEIEKVYLREKNENEL
jgi:hypothetical protein